VPPDAEAIPTAFGRLRARLREPRQQLYAAVLVLLMAGLAVLAFYPYGKSLGTAVGVASENQVHGRDIRPGSAFVADAALHAPDTPIVVVTPRTTGRSQNVVIDVLRFGRARRERVLAFPGKPLGPPVWSLVRWRSGLGIARISHRGRAAQCVVVSLSNSRPLFAGRFSLPRDVGTDFKLSLAPGPGSTPDLYVLEFGREPPPNPFTGDLKNARLHVLSGASGFRQQTADISTPLRDLTSSEWTFSAARIVGEKANLVLVRHARGVPAEIHVLNGATKYQTFLSERQLGLSGTEARGMQFIPVNRNGRPALVALDPQRAEVTVRTFVF
jgi:hypothetical protein